jgi:NAD(P)-dependent dehydrogenase (short-subunit alcohol dehydrogenase family)
MTTAFLPLLSAASKTRPNFRAGVINVASISGITRTSQHHFNYNASKAATIQLTNLLAQELRRPGVNVRVNAISPGIFPSEMTTDESDEKNKSQIPAGDDYGKKKGIPAGRAGGEADMAQAALYLGCNQYAYNSVRMSLSQTHIH